MHSYLRERTKWVGLEEELCKDPQREMRSSRKTAEPTQFLFGEHFGYHRAKSCRVITEHQISLQSCSQHSDFSPGALELPKYPCLTAKGKKKKPLCVSLDDFCSSPRAGRRQLCGPPASPCAAGLLQVSISSRKRGRCQRLQKNSFRELFRSASL